VKRRNRSFSEVAGIPAEVWRGYRLCHSALLFLDWPSRLHKLIFGCAAFIEPLQQFSASQLMLEEVWMVEIELFHRRQQVPSRNLPRVATCTVPSDPPSSADTNHLSRSAVSEGKAVAAIHKILKLRFPYDQMDPTQIAEPDSTHDFSVLLGHVSGFPCTNNHPTPSHCTSCASPTSSAAWLILAKSRQIHS